MTNWKLLSGLRFFLAWIVVCEHMRYFIPGSDDNPLFLFGRLNAVAAVLGFLVISGYSIASSITKKQEGFYRRRVLRIYPLYLLAVVVSIIPYFIPNAEIAVPRQSFIQPDFWTATGNLLLLQGFAVDPIQLNPVLWTLSVEVICYLLAPFFLKAGNKILSVLIVLSSVLYVAFPYVHQVLYPGTIFPFYSSLKYGLAFVILLWAWLLGFVYYLNSEKKAAKAIIFLGTLLLVLNQNHTGKFGIITYTIAGLLLVFSSNIKIPKLVANILNYLGEISYPIYLFHVPVIICAYVLVGIQDSSTLAFISVLASMVFYHAVDVPLRSRKKKTVLST